MVRNEAAKRKPKSGPLLFVKMGSLWTYLDRLERARDDYAKKAMREKYSILILAGTLDMDLSRKYAFWSILLAAFFYSVLISVNLSMIAATFLLSYDFESASGVGNLALLISLSIGFLMNFHVLRGELLHYHSMMGKGIFEYSTEQLETEEMKVFQKKMRFQQLLLVFLALYVCSIGVLVFLGPWIDSKFGHGYPTVYDEYGVNRRIPVPMYLLFKNDEGIGYVIAMSLIPLTGSITCCVIGGTSLVFSMSSQFILTEQKKLFCSIKTLTYRAKTVYLKPHNVDKIAMKSKQLYDDPEFQDAIYFCLRENVEHHHAIVKFIRIFEHFAKEPLFSSFVIVTVAIGLSMIKLNEGVSKVGSSVSFAAVAIGELMNMLNIAVYGEYFLTLSEEINREIYFTPWYKFNLKNRKMIKQFLIGTHKPVGLSTWFVRMDMAMFTSVMNTAYSFFNFIKLSKSHENA